MLNLDPTIPSRVIILGCSGSGKSTLGVVLAERFGLPFVPTDDIYWRPDWTPVPACELRAWLEKTTAEERWVLDGNFDAQRDLLWGRADLAVWLDLPWIVTLLRVARRNLRWWITRATIWGGLRMTFPRLAAGVFHAARSHSLKRRTYPDLLASFPGLKVVHIRSASELKTWINSQNQTPPPSFHSAA